MRRIGPGSICICRVTTMTMPVLPAWASDRREVIECPDSAKATMLVPGVELCPLVGGHNGARPVHRLVDPGSQGCVSSLHSTVCRDAGTDGGRSCRRCGSSPLPAWLVGCAHGPRGTRAAGGQPFGEPGGRDPPRHVFIDPRTDLGQHSVRASRPARRHPRAHGSRAALLQSSGQSLRAGAQALFQDLYNADLGAKGICGGHGVFEPGARLPCHRHEFDESITIIQGTATCVVEGQRYELSGNATALVPQGRCHYFINLTLEPMAMLWVYAGDRPDRIVMDETYCHPEKARGTRGARLGV